MTLFARGRLRAATLAVLMAAAVALTGCPPGKVRVCPTEFFAIEQLIDQNNANAAKVPQLWARADITIYLADEKGKRNPYNVSSGMLLLEKDQDRPLGPQSFLLRGRELNKELFRLGCDPSAGVYYFWYNVSADSSGARWGRLEHLNKPGSEGLGFDPMQLLSVLNVLPWQSDLDGLPHPVMTAAADPCVYVMQFLAPRPGRTGLYVQREIWLDRYERTHWPTRVRLYDPDGRNIMDARLAKYKTIETDAPEADWPVMPTDIQIEWPLTKSALRLQLSEMSTQHHVSSSVFPMAIPDDIPPQNRVQVDREYDVAK